MICLRCDSEDFAEVHEAEIEQEFKGELLKVKSPALMCSMCGWVTVDPAQVDELRRRTADAYRVKHGLLTSEDIKIMRKALGKTQRDFAAFLGVGEASVKRWETWMVQDKSNDRLMRLKCLYAPLVQGEPGYIAVKTSTATTTVTVTMVQLKGKIGPDQPEDHAQMLLGAGRAGDGQGPPGGGEYGDMVAYSLSAPCLRKGGR
jgi:putative zinc finger/helix-turn-helix YgiT family protein